MENANASLLVLSAWGALSSGFWTIFALYPLNPFFQKVVAGSEGIWIIVDIIVLAMAAGVHVHHRRNR